MIQRKPKAIECKIFTKLLRIKKPCYNLINTINVKTHLKGTRPKQMFVQILIYKYTNFEVMNSINF